MVDISKASAKETVCFFWEFCVFFPAFSHRSVKMCELGGGFTYFCNIFHREMIQFDGPHIFQIIFHGVETTN